MCVLSLIAAMGPSLCMSEFDCSSLSQSMHIESCSSFGSPPVCIRLQLLQWVSAHVYQGSIAALGPSHRIQNYNPCSGSRPVHIRVLSHLSGPSPCILDYNPCYGSRPTCIGVLLKLWVLAHVYQTTTPAMGPGPYVSGFCSSLRSWLVHI